MGLDGRVALVTGGGRGIGRGIALALAEDGADVAVNYNKDEESAQKTAEEIRGLGRRAMVVRASVESYDDDKAMVDAVVDELGSVGILISNAGVASRGKTVADTDPDEVKRVLGIHAIGAHHLCSLVLPSMREQERGDIVVISSIATRSNAANGAPYAMAKAALEVLASCLAKEEMRNGIRVNIVAPGLVETEMGRRLVKGTMGLDDISKLHDASPFGRVCQPEDVANVVRFLVSEAGGYVTGQRLYVDGSGAF